MPAGDTTEQQQPPPPPPPPLRRPLPTHGSRHVAAAPIGSRWPRLSGRPRLAAMTGGRQGARPRGSPRPLPRPCRPYTEVYPLRKRGAVLWSSPAPGKDGHCVPSPRRARRQQGGQPLPGSGALCLCHLEASVPHHCLNLALKLRPESPYCQKQLPYCPEAYTLLATSGVEVQHELPMKLKHLRGLGTWGLQPPLKEQSPHPMTLGPQKGRECVSKPTALSFLTRAQMNSKMKFKVQSISFFSFHHGIIL